MILKNKLVNGKWSMVNRAKPFVLLMFCGWMFNFATCKYSFKDVSIPAEVKTFRVTPLENKARYVNTQLSPQLTEKLKQKIIGNTRLTQTNNDNANYDIGGYVSDYNVSVNGISGTAATGNLLTVTFHLIFKNNLDEKKNQETDVTSTYPFSGNISLNDAERTLNDDIVKNVVDAIFNKIFSNW